MAAFSLVNIILLLVCFSLYLLNFWISVTKRSNEKLSTYECGLVPMGNSRLKFDIIYYIIGILYLIFDLEIIFLFPLASIIYILQSNITILYILLFLIIITIGFIYEWFQGALVI